MSLTTAYEVLKYSGAGKSYPMLRFCNLIPEVEETFTRKCLGQELYDYLVDHLVEYPVDAVEWISGQTYTTDDVVIRNGCLFTSTAFCNTSDPLEDEENWTPFERFDTAGANTLWKKYLRTIFARMVYAESLFQTTWQSDSTGIIVNKGDNVGYRSADKSELSTIMNDLKGKIANVTDNMLNWLKNNGEDAGLPVPESCKTRNCPTPGRQTRRIAFAK